METQNSCLESAVQTKHLAFKCLHNSQDALSLASSQLLHLILLRNLNLNHEVRFVKDYMQAEKAVENNPQ